MQTLSRALGAMFTPTKPRQPDTQATARKQAKAIAASLGIELERFNKTGIAFNVWPPKGIRNDPFEGDHYCNDWHEVLHMCKEYQDIVSRQK